MVVRRVIELDDETERHACIARALETLGADQILPLLKDESERHLNINPNSALRLAASLVFGGTLCNQPAYHALGLMATGDAYRVLGRFQDSVDVMNEAGTLYLALGDEVGWARTRNGWLRSSHYLGHGAAALAEADRARTVLEKHGAWLRLATMTYNTAFVCAELGRHEESLARYDQAQAIYDSLGETAEIWSAHMKFNKAVLLTQLGDFQAALRLYDQNRALYARHGQTVSMLRLDEHVALVHAAQGRYTRALRYYSSALAAMEETNLDIDAAWVSLNMVECYLSLHRNTEALELATEAIQRFEGHGALTEAATARLYGAMAYARLGDTDRALEFLTLAVEVFSATGFAVHLAHATLQRAALYLEIGEEPAAAAESAHASGLFAERGLVVRRAQADLIHARAALALRRDTDAESLAGAALVVSRDKDVPWLTYECQHLLGGVARARGDIHGALDHYGRAVTSIESLQSTLAVELRTNFLADKIRVYEDAIAASLRLSRPELAFAYLERAKSRALVDYLAGNLDVQIRAREGTNPNLLESLTRLREEHNFFYNRLYGHGLAQRDGEASVRLDEAALRAAIAARERRIARLLERLALDRTEGLNVPATTEGDYAVPPLNDRTVLLEYYLREDGGVIFVGSPAGLSVVPLSARPGEIRRLLHQWHLNVSTAGRMIATGAPLDGVGRNARNILAALYRALIAPVAANIAGCERVIVIPYGQLHAVPFHALYDGARYLIENFEVSVCLSSRLLRLCTEQPRRAGRSALVIAHSNGGRLPAVLDEARAVAAVLPGEIYREEQATRAALVDAAPRHGVIHLAAHGEARLDNPTFAHIQLADGQLGAADVFNLPLAGALVTLSACETGRAEITEGNELVGLSRGFLFAGASTLVQSLWRVEDGATAELMAHFYRGLRAGRTKGDALREAQRALLASYGAHPYRWAPFQIIGDAGPL